MKLFEKIGQTVGKTVFPIKNTDIYEFAIPAVEKPAQHLFRSPQFGNTKVFRIPGAILQEVSIVPNLLFDLPEIEFRSGFEPLSSRIFGTNEITFARTQISESLIELFHSVESNTWVSDNLFSPLSLPGKNGKEYTHKQEKAHKQHSLFEETPHANQTNGFQKAYKRIKTPNSISANTTQSLSFWDLIYPILLPPLSLDFVPQLDLPHELYPYQKTGISFLVNNESALLGDEMGTGKTVMSVVALRLMFRLGKAQKALIICPVNLWRVWQAHLLDWASELEITVVRGPKSTRELDWKYPAHVYLTTYETVTNDFLTSVKKKVNFNCPNCGASLVFNDKIHLQGDGGLPNFRCPTCKSLLDNVPTKSSLVDPEILNSFDVVIIDEAQYIKNRNSDRSRAVKIIKPKFRWALSGTPMENKLDDLVSIFEFVKPNYLRSEGLTPKLAAQQIKPYFLRRLKKDVLPDLPDKIKQEFWLELEGTQKTEYEAALQQGRTKLEELGHKVSKIHIFALLQELKQICNFAKDGTSVKAKALIERVEEICEIGQKVLIFSQYIPCGIDKLEELLSPYGVTVLKGGMSDPARQMSIKRFKDDRNTKVFLLAIQTGGVGLTLTEASYVILFDHWWNPATMRQAEDRVHRPGQKSEKVIIYSYWIYNSIEERIYRKLQEKGLLFDEVINGLSEEAIDEMISTDEWLEMLGVKPLPNQRTVRANQTASTVSSIPEILDRLSAISPVKFEDVVKITFAKIGFTNVRTTKMSHDGGIDVIGYRRNIAGTEKVIAQCKRMARVGVEVARELLGVIAADQTIAKGFIVTSGTVSAECKAFCEKDGRLSIIDGPLLANYILQFGVEM